MEAILCLIAIIYAGRSHYRCKRIFGPCSLVKQLPPITPQKPLYTPAGQESSWLGPIVIAILLLLAHFFC